MTSPVNLFRGVHSEVRIGGTPVVATYALNQGALIYNPWLAADQGLPWVEVLWLDLVNPAVTYQTSTCIPIQPGEWFRVPPNSTTDVTVNAQTSGHRFSIIVIQPKITPVLPGAGAFPPAGPTSLLETIKSYLYLQYNDDDDLQAFVSAYNSLTQQYLDWFNTINLPVYPNSNVSGPLLDWVLSNLYGQTRPTLSSGRNRNLGPLNTFSLNVLSPNQRKLIGAQNVAVTNDDFYKRIMTWNFYRGDGEVVNVRWLKRRIMRFILGINGADVNPNITYQVSITFGLSGQVNITLIKRTRTVTGGAIPGRAVLNTRRPDQLSSTFVDVDPLPDAVILKEAIDAGALQLPFQFTYVVNV